MNGLMTDCSPDGASPAPAGPAAARSVTRSLLPRIGPAERRIVDRAVELLVGQPHRRAIILRIEHRPAVEQQSAGRAGLALEGDGDAAIFAVLGVLPGEQDDVGAAARDRLRDPADILVGIEQQGERRVADRPARHLLHRIIYHRQRLAVADDEQRHALLILEAHLAGLFELQRAGERAAVAIGLGEVGSHRLHGAQMRLNLREIGRERDRRGSGEKGRGDDRHGEHGQGTHEKLRW